MINYIVFIFCGGRFFPFSVLASKALQWYLPNFSDSFAIEVSYFSMSCMLSGDCKSDKKISIDSLKCFIITH